NLDAGPSAYSTPQHFRTGTVGGARVVPRYPVTTTDVAPMSFEDKGSGHYFIDFGKDAFGTLAFTLPAATPAATVDVRLGEAALADHTVDPSPGGSVVSLKTTAPLKAGTTKLALARGVSPFRYVELTGVPFKLDATH